MSAIRVTAMLCITVLVIITGALVHTNNQDRFIILPQNNSMFIFDRKTSAVNYCTADQCKLVMPYGSTSMPGMSPLGMSSGMLPMVMSGMPQGFQPYAMPGANNASMMVSTSMNNPMGNAMGNPMMAGNNNPMMMWAYMQAASAASTAAQQGGFSSLQSQPSWMNMMAMMQPAATSPGSTVAAQSPIVPVAMTTADVQPNQEATPPAAEESTASDSEETPAASSDTDTPSDDASPAADTSSDDDE